MCLLRTPLQWLATAPLQGRAPWSHPPLGPGVAAAHNASCGAPRRPAARNHPPACDARVMHALYVCAPAMLLIALAYVRAPPRLSACWPAGCCSWWLACAPTTLYCRRPRAPARPPARDVTVCPRMHAQSSEPAAATPFEAARRGETRPLRALLSSCALPRRGAPWA
ncbi:MAG: hypothetical protein J3K34DRAFT_286011 [Monoraphidium minutum]|nr:MAG: hypothetical protein J3K34DRAFT_286011 [Monoraphidium minutum]